MLSDCLYLCVCARRDRCNFSHEILPGMEEPPPPPETKILSMRLMDINGEKNEFYRTKPCKFFFERGMCLKGDLCNYSHDPELYEEFLRSRDYTDSDDEYDECYEDTSGSESYEDEQDSGSEDNNTSKKARASRSGDKQNNMKEESEPDKSKAKARPKVQTNEKDHVRNEEKMN